MTLSATRYPATRENVDNGFASPGFPPWSPRRRASPLSACPGFPGVRVAPVAKLSACPGFRVALVYAERAVKRSGRTMMAAQYRPQLLAPVAGSVAVLQLRQNQANHRQEKRGHRYVHCASG